MGSDAKTREQQREGYNRQVTDEAVFKASKEIVVKFIEMGRLTPTNFEETFDRIYKAVRKSVHSA